jgi:hypothetical protein
MRKLWRSVSSLSPSLGLASVVFEAYIHRRFCDRIVCTVGKTHGVNDKLLQFMDEKFDDLPASASLRFVFVIPDPTMMTTMTESHSTPGEKILKVLPSSFYTAEITISRLVA